MISLNADLRKSQINFGADGGSELVQLGAFGEERYCFFFNISMRGVRYVESSA